MLEHVLYFSYMTCLGLHCHSWRGGATTGCTSLRHSSGSRANRECRQPLALLPMFRWSHMENGPSNSCHLGNMVLNASCRKIVMRQLAKTNAPGHTEMASSVSSPASYRPFSFQSTNTLPVTLVAGTSVPTVATVLVTPAGRDVATPFCSIYRSAI